MRFLNEVGGGIVVGFEGNKTVIVQDESGFDIPFPIHEVIAVETNDYNIAKVNTRKSAEPTQVGPSRSKQSLKSAAELSC